MIVGRGGTPTVNGARTFFNSCLLCVELDSIHQIGLCFVAPAAVPWISYCPEAAYNHHLALQNRAGFCGLNSCTRSASWQARLLLRSIDHLLPAAGRGGQCRRATAQPASTEPQLHIVPQSQLFFCVCFVCWFTMCVCVYIYIYIYRERESAKVHCSRMSTKLP